jgi:hypothetical protein
MADNPATRRRCAHAGSGDLTTAQRLAFNYRDSQYCGMKRIVFTPASTRQWVKLAADVRRRIDGRLTEFAISGKGDVKRLKGREGFPAQGR